MGIIVLGIFYFLPMAVLIWAAFVFDVEGDTVTRNRSLILAVLPTINFLFVVVVTAWAVWAWLVKQARKKD